NLLKGPPGKVSFAGFAFVSGDTQILFKGDSPKTFVSGSSFLFSRCSFFKVLCRPNCGCHARDSFVIIP
ncbi:hypothetical protein, partial [uncultured Anaerotruncus sp.]|uniref:hypothetical protein n=1 Tax=uncultured Anaerotruncus sp. TaxID=905011 RepID=UPI0025862E4E